MKIRTHLAIIILMILGAAIMLNQVSQPLMVKQSKASTEQSKDGGATETGDDYVLQANVAINSFTPISLHQELYQIREIILDEVDDPQSVLEVENLRESDHFKTLFRQVISPNAP